MKLQMAQIRREMVKKLILQYHYSGRVPGIKYSWGLYDDGDLVGCVVYSVPASYTLCTGVCGPSYRARVIELSRLVVITPERNAASFLVGQSLRRINNSVIVSYADCNDHVGHIGYVYQATNWLYTGQGNAEPMWIEDKTRKIVSLTRRHIDAKARELGYDWKVGASSGPGLSPVKQQGKHRYVTFTGDKRFVREAIKNLRYPVMPYPKGETRRHDGCSIKIGSRYTPTDVSNLRG